jgi:hypothetical protein
MLLLLLLLQLLLAAGQFKSLQVGAMQANQSLAMDAAVGKEPTSAAKPAEESWLDTG